MTKKLLVPALIFLAICCGSCHYGNSHEDRFSTDTAVISKGEIAFNRNCSGCHNFRQDGIGPMLGGLTDSIPKGWIENFIRDPNKSVASGDSRAAAIFQQYKVIMPSFANLTGEDMQGILAFLHIHKKAAIKSRPFAGKEIVNPFPKVISLSGLVANLELVTQFPASSDSGKSPLARITQMGYQPGTGRSFILDLRGKLYSLEQSRPAVYMDMAKLRPAFIAEPGLATGFGSFAFHPDFARNGLMYTTHTEGPGVATADFGYGDSIKVTLQWVITEWKTDDPLAPVFSGKGREILRINMVSGIHGVQQIAFNPHSRPADKDYGLLYIGIGDGGAVENGYPELAHNRKTLWGTIIRIDPAGRNSANKQYGIPPQNPFVLDTAGGSRREIFAYGFRNPHRITWLKNGSMLASNVGQAKIESLYLILPGRDYGWPVREGNFVIDPYGDISKVYALPANDSAAHITYPVAAFDHDEGKAICGGFEYQGKKIPALNGKFLFGDIPSGRLFYINVADIRQGNQAQIMEWKIMLGGRPVNLKDLSGSQRADLHFGRDAQGELYMMTKADGKIYRITGAHTDR